MKLFLSSFLALTASFVFSLAHAQTAPVDASRKPLFPSWAESNPYKYDVQLSPYTQHYSPKDPEDRDVFLIGVEREHPNGKLDGVAFFSNTFGQESLYFFPWGGVYKGIGGIAKLSFKWTAGIIYGYKEPYNKKVPLNYKGFSPGIVPAINYEFDSKWSAQLNFLGSAGVMFQLNVPLNY